MNNEFANLETPTLTLDPFQEAPQVVTEVKKEEPMAEENVLSDEEKQIVAKFAEQIDLTNSQMILQYGAGTQKKMARADGGGKCIIR